MSKINVAVIAGGTSAEREVSLKSGLNVFKALDRKKYEVNLYDPANDLPRIVSLASKIDVAFLALHGRGGEDGTIQGFLELLGIPYTGSGIRASANSIDKITAKKIYRSASLPVAPELVVNTHEDYSLTEIIKTLGLPCVVKPAREGSSLGISIPTTKKALSQSIHSALKLDSYVLLEKYLSGREFTVAILGNADPEPLPVIEIISKHNFFDYQAKYDPNLTQEVCPAKISPRTAKRFQSLCRSAHLALGCRGASRTDLIWNPESDTIYLLETNTIPGLTSASLLPKAAAAVGYSFPDFLSHLINLALEENPSASPSPKPASSSIPATSSS